MVWYSSARSKYSSPNRRPPASDRVFITRRKVSSTGGTPQTLADRIPAIIALLVLGAGLTALFLGYDWFWMVFVLGFAVVLPITAILSESLFGGKGKRKSEVSEDDVDERQDALDTLRDRYARGEIDEAEFERRVDLLLENETVADGSKERAETELSGIVGSEIAAGY